jgi:hypothetical protein
MKNILPAPAGYRELNLGEIIEKGDYKFINGRFEIADDPEKFERYQPSVHWNGRYRKIEGTIGEVGPRGPEGKTMNIKEAYLAMQANCGIEVGDTVRVVRTAKNNEMGWQNTWTPTMTGMVGKTFTVKSVGTGSGIYFEAYNFPFFVLELVSKKPVKPTEIKVKLNTDYSADCTKDSVKVGCQTFGWDVIEKLIETKKQLTS